MALWRVFTYRVDEEQRTVVTTVSGAVSDKDLVEHVETITADCRIAADSCALIDFRSVTDFDVTIAGVRRAASRFEVAGSRFKRVAFVATEDLVYGPGRVYQAVRESTGSVQLGVVRDVDEAKAWIGSS